MWCKSGKEGGTTTKVGASLSQNGTRHRMHLQRNHQPTRPLASTYVQCCALHGGYEMGRWCDGWWKGLCTWSLPCSSRAVDTGTFSQLECTILTCHLMNGFRTSIHKIPGPNSTTLGKAASRLEAIPRKIIVLNTGSWRSPCSTTKWANPTVMCREGQGGRLEERGTVSAQLWWAWSTTSENLLSLRWCADSDQRGKTQCEAGDPHLPPSLCKKKNRIPQFSGWERCEEHSWIRPTQHRGRHTKNLVTERGKSLHGSMEPDWGVKLVTRCTEIRVRSTNRECWPLATTWVANPSPQKMKKCSWNF